MTVDRRQKVAKVLQEIAAEFVQHEANSYPLITITNVDLSPDFRRAIVFFTTMPTGTETDAAIFLKRSATDMRNYIKTHARLKRIPHLEFMVDAGERYRQDFDALLQKVHEDEEQ